MRAAIITQWIRLRLPSCGPGFKSCPCFFNLYLKCSVKRPKINKKETRIGTFKKTSVRCGSGQRACLLFQQSEILLKCTVFLHGVVQNYQKKIKEAGAIRYFLDEAGQCTYVFRFLGNGCW